MDALLVRIHLKHRAHLRECHIFAIAKANDFIECLEDFKARLENILLLERVAPVSDRTSKKMECVDILEDVRVLCCDQDHIQVLKRLVHIAHTVSFDRGVL